MKWWPTVHIYCYSCIRRPFLASNLDFYVKSMSKYNTSSFSALTLSVGWPEGHMNWQLIKILLWMEDRTKPGVFSRNMTLYLSPFQQPFSRWTWVSQYQNVSILYFVGTKDDGAGGDNWSYKTCKVPVKLLPSTNQHPTFYRQNTTVTVWNDYDLNSSHILNYSCILHPFVASNVKFYVKFTFKKYNIQFLSVLWHCHLGDRKGSRTIKIIAPAKTFLDGRSNQNWSNLQKICQLNTNQKYH